MTLDEFLATALPDSSTLQANESVTLNEVQRGIVIGISNAIGDAFQLLGIPMYTFAKQTKMTDARFSSLLPANNPIVIRNNIKHNLTVWKAVALIRAGRHLNIQPDPAIALTQILPQLTDINIADFALGREVVFKANQNRHRSIRLPYEQMLWLHIEYGKIRQHASARDINFSETVVNPIVTEKIMNRTATEHFNIQHPRETWEVSIPIGERSKRAHEATKQDYGIQARELKVLLRMAELVEYPGLDALRSTLDTWVSAMTANHLRSITPRTAALTNPVTLPPGRYDVIIGGVKMELDSGDKGITITPKPDPKAPAP